MRKPKTDDSETAGADIDTTALPWITELDRQKRSKGSPLQYTVKHKGLSTANPNADVGKAKADYEEALYTTHSRNSINSSPDMMGHYVQLSADRSRELVLDDSSSLAK